MLSAMSKSKLVGTWKLDNADADWNKYMKTVGEYIIVGLCEQILKFLS